MNPAATQPREIELERTRELRIRWADGTIQTYPLAELRRACPCAACRDRREKAAAGGLPVLPGPDEQRAMATASDLEIVGRYALRIRWQDGHDAGIYDFELLRALGGRENCS